MFSAVSAVRVVSDISPRKSPAPDSVRSVVSKRMASTELDTVLKSGTSVRKIF